MKQPVQSIVAASCEKQESPTMLAHPASLLVSGSIPAANVRQIPILSLSGNPMLGRCCNVYYPYKKRTDYYINYEFVAHGTVVYNYLEDCEYEAKPGKDVKLIGTVGEEWLTSEEKLYATYDCDGQGVAYPLSNAGIVWVRMADGCEKVATSLGDALTANLAINSRGQDIPHGDGDMVACADAGGSPNEGDQWIINGAVFANTYEPA